MGFNNHWLSLLLDFTGNGDHSPENTIHHNTQNTLWGNKPLIVQFSCDTIKSTTAQTFENAENAEMSQGWYVAALKMIATAHGRGERGSVAPLPCALRSAQKCTGGRDIWPLSRVQWLS